MGVTLIFHDYIHDTLYYIYIYTLYNIISVWHARFYGSILRFMYVHIAVIYFYLYEILLKSIISNFIITKKKKHRLYVCL